MLRLKMEHGSGGALDVGLNLLKDDAGVKAALGARSHLSLQALHRSLTLEKLCGCYIVMLPCECRVETCELSLERHALQVLPARPPCSRLEAARGGRCDVA